MEDKIPTTLKEDSFVNEVYGVLNKWYRDFNEYHEKVMIDCPDVMSELMKIENDLDMTILTEHDARKMFDRYCVLLKWVSDRAAIRRLRLRS